jgi:phosphate transport system permease protein
MKTASNIDKAESNAVVLSSPQSLKIRKQEKVAKGIIWFLAVLTIAILVWIIGYLMVKGLWYDNSVPYSVTNQVDTNIPILGSDGSEFGDVVFIIHHKTRSEDITVEALRKLYNKVRTENWGFYNQQDLKVVPYAFDGAPGFSSGIQDFILQGTDLDDYRKTVSRVDSWDEMIQNVATHPGALGFIPAEMAENLPDEVKTLGVRRTSVAVHPSVLQIQDGRMLREISSDQEKALVDGQIANWQEVGGTDLPVVLIRMKGASAVRDLSPKAKIIEAENEEEFYTLLQDTEGAVALASFGSLAEYELSYLPVLRHETGRNLTWHFIFEAPARSGQWGGISYIIINTFFLILFTIIFSTPVGVMAAIYMIEYAKQGRLIGILRMGSETLAGIPSIVFGLFGFIFFVKILGMGIGFISSTLTITLMVLPTIIRTTEEALKSVPHSLREGSLALGATKLQTIVKVVLPTASPGILTGIILAIGRTVGETAVLIYTLGSNYDLVSGPSSSARVLSLHLYMLFSEALSFDRTFATAAVLVIIILITNLSTTRILKRVNKNSGM